MNAENAVRTAHNLSVRDEVFKLITHLHAQSILIAGEGMENFLLHNDEIKSNYLWSICELAERSLVLLSSLDDDDTTIRNALED
jgi:hypothetical protein